MCRPQRQMRVQATRHPQASTMGVAEAAAAVAGSALWHATLELMGGQFADLSTALKTTYTGYRPDVMGHGKKQDAGAPEQSSQPTDAHHSPDEQKEQP